MIQLNNILGVGCIYSSMGHFRSVRIAGPKFIIFITSMMMIMIIWRMIMLIPDEVVNPGSSLDRVGFEDGFHIMIADTVPKFYLAIADKSQRFGDSRVVFVTTTPEMSVVHRESGAVVGEVVRDEFLNVGVFFKDNVFVDVDQGKMSDVSEEGIGVNNSRVFVFVFVFHVLLFLLFLLDTTEEMINHLNLRRFLVLTSW